MPSTEEVNVPERKCYIHWSWSVIIVDIQYPCIQHILCIGNKTCTIVFVKSYVYSTFAIHLIGWNEAACMKYSAGIK